MHASCVCNELVSLYNRHLVDRSYLKYNVVSIKAGFKLLGKYIKFKTERVGLWDVVRNYNGRKKRVYHKAATDLIQEGFREKYARVQMFVKPDRWPEGVISDKAPRAIQYRRPHFNLALASYLEPFEKKVYDELKPFGTRVIAKGLNLRQRGELFMCKIRKFRNPVFYSIDHSKFDSTVNVEHLKNLHTLYKRVVGKSVHCLLKYQLRTKGYTKHGIKYRLTGTRCSGDFDTGLGNSLINTACILYCFRNYKFDFMLDGDDTIVIVEGKCNVDADDFREFGFDTKLIQCKDKYQVEFCQSRLIWNRGWMFSRNPLRAISHQCYTLRKYGLKGIARYLAGVGRCELACSAGVPILMQQGLRLAKCSNVPIYDRDVQWKMLVSGWALKPQAILWRTRQTFAKAWGISIGLQLVIETSLLPLSLSWNKAIVLYSELAERDRVEVPGLRYDAKQLFESWTRMAVMGFTSGPVWWGAC